MTDTATAMPGYKEYEVGAGYINAYAAVDKVYNRTKNYQNFSNPTFNAVFGEEHPALQSFHLDFSPEASGPDSVNATHFTIQPGMSSFDMLATVDTIAEQGTGNFVGIRVTSPSGITYSTAIDTPVIGSDKREIVVQNPEAGTWTLEVRGARGLTAAPGVSSPVQVASPGPVDGSVSQVKYILPNIADIQGNPLQSDIEFALRNRLIDTYADGTFRPANTVTREDLARSLALNTPMRQVLAASPKFTDVSGDLERIAEAVTAKGSTLRDYDFVSGGMISFTGTAFNPTGSVNRLDLAVALVKALGHDAEARALAGTNVTSGGTVLSDNTQIPSALRGYVQVALNLGLFEAFPAEVRQIAPGVYQAIPGPRFEPATVVTRAQLAQKLNGFRQLFTTGG
jgi:serine protease AprX